MYGVAYIAHETGHPKGVDARRTAIVILHLIPMILIAQRHTGIDGIEIVYLSRTLPYPV
jgi:hypothetical protein